MPQINKHYVRTAITNGLPNNHIDGNRMGHMSAAIRTTVIQNWNSSSYQYPRAKGFTAETFAVSISSRIGEGDLRGVRLDEPALVSACKALFIPCSYKAIETYLKGRV